MDALGASMNQKLILGIFLDPALNPYPFTVINHHHKSFAGFDDTFQKAIKPEDSLGTSELELCVRSESALVNCCTIQEASMCAKLLQSCPTICNPMDGICQTALWDSSGKNTGLGCHPLLQRIFLIQELNISYISCIGRQVLYTSSATWHKI